MKNLDHAFRLHFNSRKLLLLKILLMVGLLKLASSADCQNKAWQRIDAKFGSESGPKGSVETVHAVNENVLWIGLSGGRYGLSKDGGVNWVTGTIMDSTDVNLHILGFDENRALVLQISLTTFLSKLFFTKDGGKTWSDIPGVFKSGKSYIDGAMVFDSKTAVIYGDPVDGYHEIYRTINAGDTWTRVEKTKMPEASVSGVLLLTGFSNTFTQNSGWNSTDNGNLLYTKNKGETWEVLTCTKFPAVPISLNATGEKHLNILYTTDITSQNSPNEFLSTDDGGKLFKPWSNLPANVEILTVRPIRNTGGSYFLLGVGPDGKTKELYTIDNFKSFKTFDGGITVTQDVSFPSFYFYNSKTGWAFDYFDENGKPIFISKWTGKFDNISSTKLPKNELVGSVSPNPTSGLIRIDGEDNADITTFDVTGKVVLRSKLVNQEADITQVPPGLYFIKVENLTKNQIYKVIKN
jgi:photosystem II stability/assembly factor-like uncharacterized protein